MISTCQPLQGDATVRGSSIEHDLVAQLEARNAHLANLAVFRTAGRLGRVVDLYA